MKDKLLPVNAPTFSAGMRIDLAGYLDNCLLISAALKRGSFSEAITACQTSSKGNFLV